MASLIIPIAIDRDLDLDRLAVPPDARAIAEADKEGYLDGNRSFRDLGGMTWAELAETLEIERPLLARLEAASDLDEEEEAILEELDTEFGAEALWGLDPGVASATIAVSALGATPVASCSAGVLGGHHREEYPLVAFYLPRAIARRVEGLADRAGAGLLLDDSGRAQLYAGSYRPLLRFAELSLEESATQAPWK